MEGSKSSTSQLLEGHSTPILGAFGTDDLETVTSGVRQFWDSSTMDSLRGLG